MNTHLVRNAQAIVGTFGSIDAWAKKAGVSWATVKSVTDLASAQSSTVSTLEKLTLPIGLLPGHLLWSPADALLAGRNGNPEIARNGAKRDLDAYDSYIEAGEAVFQELTAHLRRPPGAPEYCAVIAGVATGSSVIADAVRSGITGLNAEGFLPHAYSFRPNPQPSHDHDTT